MRKGCGKGVSVGDHSHSRIDDFSFSIPLARTDSKTGHAFPQICLRSPLGIFQSIGSKRVFLTQIVKYSHGSAGPIFSNALMSKLSLRIHPVLTQIHPSVDANLAIILSAICWSCSVISFWKFLTQAGIAPAESSWAVGFHHLRLLFRCL